jgi:hypothetical protein
MSESSKRCANCHTERYEIYRRGYCHRCYPVILKREKVEARLRALPKDEPNEDESNQVWIRKYSERQRAKSIRNELKELEFRLSLLEGREEQRTSRVDGHDIELVLRDLARWCGAKEVSLHHVASAVHYYGFNQEQRRVLLGWLLDIEEGMRWNRRRYPGLRQSLEH